MAGTFKFYTDSGLTTELTTSIPFAQAADGSSGPADAVMYLGSTTSGRKLENNSTPGTGQVTVTIVDSASGSGEPTTAVKLATTNGGLASATAGAALNLGTSVLSSTPQAIHIRVTDATATIGNYTDLSLQILNVRESAV